MTMVADGTWENGGDGHRSVLSLITSSHWYQGDVWLSWTAVSICVAAVHKFFHQFPRESTRVNFGALDTFVTSKLCNGAMNA